MVAVDVVGDSVVLIDVASMHIPIKIEVWLVVTMMITMLAGKVISY